MVELVIFDMDGLMLDTEQVSYKLCREILFEMLGPVPEEQLQKDFTALIGRNHKNCIDYLRKAYPALDADIAMDKLAERMKVYIGQHGISVKKGLFELFDYLESVGCPKALATSTNQKQATYLLECAGIWGRFNATVFGDMVVNSKPNPEIFLLAASQLHITPSQCMVLEDSIPGIQAAAAAGMMPVMVPDMQQADEATRKLLYAQCASLSEVVSLLQQKR